MKIDKLIKQLEKIKAKHGNVEVMFQDPNSHGGPFSVGYVDFCVAEEDEFPEEFDMPQGFEFVMLCD